MHIWTLLLAGTLAGQGTLAPQVPAAREAPPGKVAAAPGLARLRSLYLEAVEREAAIETGLQEIGRLRSADGTAPGTEMDGVLTAYRGALVTLRAKHGFWPPARLRHLREGLRFLDAAVADHPEVAEVRYLRLMSCYYLPDILGRTASVREDFAALARLLPGERASHPEDLYRAIATFVLEHGELSPEQRASLETALKRAE